MDKEEIWRPIPFAPDYAASSLGRIKRTAPGKNKMASMAQPGRVLRPAAQGMESRYLGVALVIDGQVKKRSVHRCVAAAFHGPPPSDKHVVAHYDGNGHNNRADNLRWATQSENLADRVRHGTHERGERNRCAKLTEDVIRIIRGETASESLVAVRFGISQSHVNRIKNRVAWAHVA
jgi:hypothetical protein